MRLIFQRTRAARDGAWAAAAMAFLLSTTAASAQFYATHDPDGNTIVVDQNGQEVQIAQSDPVGERPNYCPAGSYYVSEVLTDKTELVLTDCIISSAQYTVQMAPTQSTE